MGVSSRENGLLKLVHPGRHVEIHKQPVMAAEIINKYPRHCIARPDVFKFPWIVVHPDTLLLPGQVFYLVPYHTMHNLLKAKGHLIQGSKENKPSNNYRYGYSPTRRNAHGKRRCRHQKKNDQCSSCVLVFLKTCRNNQDSDDGWSDTSFAMQTRIISKAKELYAGPSSESSAFPQDSLLNALRFEHWSGSDFSLMLPEANSTVVIKSCFRKQDSLRKMLNLEVTFGSSIVLPNNSYEITTSI